MTESWTLLSGKSTFNVHAIIFLVAKNIFFYPFSPHIATGLDWNNKLYHYFTLCGNRVGLPNLLFKPSTKIIKFKTRDLQLETYSIQNKYIDNSYNLLFQTN